MHIHILGICGTFMGSLAVIARELGHEVSGSDQNVYPPMSTQLEQAGITLHEGYDREALRPAPDLVIIGNALSRGNPAVEYVLNRNMPYMSGPEWLAREVLQHRWVLGVSGTHGKTTTATMLLWILEQAGFDPGYLIGGVPQDFSQSARLGSSDFFVIEADEYDSAFFDKRSKFIPYRPRTLILNNLEFDHADIFDSIEDIEKQFHHLVRTVPATGLLVRPARDPHLDATLARGCWTPIQSTSLDGESDFAPWRAELLESDGSDFMVVHNNQPVARVRWNMTGRHSVRNGLAAIAAAKHVGVTPDHAIAALQRFGGVKRRMELLAEVGGIRLYDDFAHHPTAIATTLEGLRQQVGDETVVAVVDPASNTMRQGIHQHSLLGATDLANRVIWADYHSQSWLSELLQGAGERHQRYELMEELVMAICRDLPQPCHIVLMSNGGMEGLRERLVTQLETCFG